MSEIGNWIVLVTVLALLGDCLYKIVVVQPTGIIYEPTTASAFFQYLVRMCLAMEGICLIPSLYLSSEHRSHFKGVMTKAYVVTVGAIICMGAFGYMANGEFTREVVLMNMEFGEVAQGLQVAYALGIMIAYAIQLFPMIEIS